MLFAHAKDENGVESNNVESNLLDLVNGSGGGSGGRAGKGRTYDYIRLKAGELPSDVDPAHKEVGTERDKSVKCRINVLMRDVIYVNVVL